MAEFEEIMSHIREGHNFLLSGGAGCGKTHTLVGVIRRLVTEYPSKHIACITYTNAAADEINRRVNHPNVSVSTIHDFLWANICRYQPQMKRVLAKLINDVNSSIKMRGVEHIDEEYFFGNSIESIEYKEYLQLSKGIISHDEVILVSKAMFETYPKIRRLVADRHPFILIDEYQDTQREVIEILLDLLSPSNRIDGNRHTLIGLFGDSMQSIYEDGVGDIDNYVTGEDAHVYEVKMEDNRRNPRLIIELANKLRTDRLQQHQSGDENAPNMTSEGKLKEGAIHFLYSLGDDAMDLNTVRHYIEEKYLWDFSDIKNTKELDLTHNLIAGRGGFPTLIDIFDGDPILKYRDRVRSYIKDKGLTENFASFTFGEVLDYLQTNSQEDSSKWLPARGQQQEFIANNTDLMTLAKTINYDVFCKMYVEKAQLIDDKKQSEDETTKKGTKRSPIIRHLFKLMQIIESYQKNHLGVFFRLTDMDRIKCVNDKVKIRHAMDSLTHLDRMTIGEVIQLADTQGVLLVDDLLERYKETYRYIFERVCAVSFSEFCNLYDYLEGRTPFSTQHKTKGTEFDHVFLLMDNGNWPMYNYSHFLSGTPRGKSERPRERTNKLFYVCCTRAKEDFVMYFPNPKDSDLQRAKALFGEDNVILI